MADIFVDATDGAIGAKASNVMPMVPCAVLCNRSRPIRSKLRSGRAQRLRRTSKDGMSLVAKLVCLRFVSK